MDEADGSEKDVGLNELLEVLSAGVGADGVLVSAGRAKEESTALASLPAGLAGRRMPLSSGLMEICGEGVKAADGLLLPAGVTGWLGFRPGYVASVKVEWAEGGGCLLFWWREQPAESARLAALLARAGLLVGDFAGRKAQAAVLEQMQHRLDAVLGNVSLGIVFVDFLSGSLLNPMGAAVLGLPESTRETAKVIAAMQQTKASCRVETPDEGAPGSDFSAEIWVNEARGLVLRVESHPVGSAQAPGRFWVFTDVKPVWESAEKVKTANRVLERNLVQLAEEMERRMEAEAELRKYNLGLKQKNEELEIAKLESDLLANQDALTGLANRRRFRHGLEDMLLEARQRDERVAVLYLDLDKFKPVNDTLGHERGDQLLRTVAETLVKGLRKDDLIARLGGDEFGCAMRLHAHTTLDEMTVLVSQLRDRLNIPVENGAETIQVSATIGVALYPDEAEDATSLLRAADNAMYVGKNQGGNEVIVFTRKGQSVSK